MLREKSQRRLFRALFVLGCVLPTLAVAGFAAQRLSPSFSRSLVERLGSQLGVRIDCMRLGTPRPGVYEMQAVAIRDSATDAPILKIDTARLAKHNGRWHLNAPDCSVADAAAAASLLARFNESGIPADTQLGRVRIGSGEVLRGVAITVGDADDGVRELSLAADDGERVQARLDAGAWQIDAITGDRGLPAAWLPNAPLPTSEGGTIRFVGSMRAEIDRPHEAVRGVAAGRFEASDLGLNGLHARRLEFAECDFRWTNQRIEHLTGRLTLSDGELSRRLVEGAATWLTLKPSDHLLSLYNEPAEPLAWFPFTQLACEVELSAGGLVLVARNDRFNGENRSGLVAHATVEHEGRPLLGEPQAPALSAQRLVRAWFSDQTAELPASPEAIEMARCLPDTTPR